MSWVDYEWVAENEFRNVPGDTRLEKILFVCSERAAHHRSKGDLNEFHGDMLHVAREHGIEHEGVDYSEIRPSIDCAAGALVRMAAQSQVKD